MRKIAVVGAGLSLFAALLLGVRYHHVVYAAVGLFAAAGFLLYLHRPRPTPRILGRLPMTAFWVLLALSLAAFAFRSDPYSRPLLYFILTAFAAGSLAVSMHHRPHRWQLAGVWAVGLSLIWTQMVMFPSLVGIDPYWHEWQASQIIARGGIIEFPAASGLHYITALLTAATGMDYRWAAFVGGTVPQVVLDSLIMYGVGGILAGKRAGLLAALATVVGNWHIFFGAWVIPNTIALTPVLALAYFLLRWYRDHQWRWTPLIVLALTWAGLTHVLATMWAGIVLVAALPLFVWQERARLRHVVSAAAFVIACLAGEAWLWWITGYTNAFRLLANSKFDPTKLGLTAPPMAGNTVTAASSASETVGRNIMSAPMLTIAPPATETLTTYQWEALVNSAGMLLFFALALTGMLVLVNRRRIGGMFVVGVVCALILLSTIPMLVGMSVVEHRWWYAAQALAAAPLAVALLRLRSAVWAAGIVAVLAFFGAIGLPTNIDNRDLSPNQIVRYALTQEEIDGTRRVMELTTGQVGVDSYLTFAARFMPEYRVRMEGISKQLVDGKLESLPPTVIIREEVRRQAFGFGEGKIWKLEYDPVVELEKLGYREFYRNRDLTALEKSVDGD